MCWRMRQASASPWFPCPKCGYPINATQGSKEYLGTSEPNELGERFRYYHCPSCAEVIKRKLD